MIAFEIVQAQPEDWEELKHIAIASKRYWGYADHLISQWAQTPIITPEAIKRDTVYVACAGLVAIGWYRLQLLLPAIVLEDLWVLPNYIGKGVGRRLFEHALIQAKRSGAHYLELEADPYAEPFYMRMGCRTVGKRISEWGRAVPHMIYDLQA